VAVIKLSIIIYSYRVFVNLKHRFRLKLGNEEKVEPFLCFSWLQVLYSLRTFTSTRKTYYTVQHWMLVAYCKAV